MRETQAQVLLDWYDVNARVMPWRVGPAERKSGVLPNPYHVWMSEVMLQQTTVAAVRDYFRAFVEKWPTVDDLAAAQDEDVMGAWAGLGYYARARNLLKCARVISTEYGGVFPDAYDGLLKLPGIGPYTAAAISAIAFDRAETVVDGNVERVMARFFAVTEPMPKSKSRLKELASQLTPRARPGDYAQAVMDLGATICTPRSPACGICPWMEGCKGRADGIAASLPAKEPKKAKPIRQGVVYVARAPNGDWLLERRPPSGLLGGMLGFVGSDWREAVPSLDPPFEAEWQDLGVEVRHTFTHFHLILTVLIANAAANSYPIAGEFVSSESFRPSDLPTVMRKVFDAARSWDGWNCL